MVLPSFERISCIFQVLKWNFTTPRGEFIEQLKEQMRPCFGKTLHTNLFHADFKFHLKGIDTMLQVLSGNPFVLKNYKLNLPVLSLQGTSKFNPLVTC